MVGLGWWIVLRDTSTAVIVGAWCGWTLESACEPLLSGWKSSRLGAWLRACVLLGVLCAGAAVGHALVRRAWTPHREGRVEFVWMISSGTRRIQLQHRPEPPLELPPIVRALPLLLGWFLLVLLYPRVHPEEDYRTSATHAVSVFVGGTWLLLVGVAAQHYVADERVGVVNALVSPLLGAFLLVLPLLGISLAWRALDRWELSLYRSREPGEAE